MPLVSVVMPVFNGEKYLAEAIDSILVQTFTDFELIIVDDGSQDGSAQIIRAYEKRDERIQFIRLEENMGPATARNCGIFASCGEYITSMDCDDVCLPERLQKQVGFLQSRPKIGGVGTHATVVDADLQYMYDRKPPQHHALILYEVFMGRDPFVHASVMLRRELPLAVSGYDLSLRNGSDSDLMLRLMGRTRFANIAECLYVYRRHESQKTTLRTARFQQDALTVHSRRFERLWGEATDAALDRFTRLRWGQKFNWRERRAAKREITRLIESMIAKNWIEPSDRPLLLAEMNRRLEQASPRIWQMFCHWWRNRFGSP